MSEFRPLREQEDAPLPERPLLNLQLGDNLSPAQKQKQRDKIINFLRLNPEQDPEIEPEMIEELLERVGGPIPADLIDDIKLCLGEMLANAHREEAGRHATGIYVWADRGKIGIGVGDDSDTMAGKDERPQTVILAPDLGAIALDAYDADFSLEGIQSSGQGGNLLLALASHVSYSLVPAGEAAREVEPRTHKIVRADFVVPIDPAFSTAA